MISFALMLAAMQVESEPLNLHLSCAGAGDRMRMSPVFTPGTTTTYVPSRTEYADTVNVEIADGDGRIRVPRSMLPGWRSGGDDGWWELRDLEITDDEITARFRINLFNNPRVRIDRLTGQLAISGRADFSGQCDAYDPETVQRRF